MGGLPREGVGARKLGMSFETEGSQSFWRDIPGLLAGYPGGRVRKRGLLEKGSFQKSPFSRDSRELEILEFLENSQTVEKKGDSDHFLEILENLEILEILEISPAKRPLS